MKTSVKNLSESKFEVTCEVEGKTWKEAQDKAEKKLIDNVEVKGFRKGHVPADMAKKHINQGQLFNEAINIVIPDAFTHAMEENKLHPITRPEVVVDKFSTSELVLKFTIVVAPKVSLGKYKGLKINKKSVEVTEQEINDAVNNTLKQNAELIVKSDAAKLGDTVIMDFEGFVDGKTFEGGKASNYELKLGSGQFIPGFEDQLVGTKAGDEKEVNVTFPEQYVENLKGKKATFKCKIHEVKEEKIPALNDETVKGLGIKDVNTVSELKEHEKKHLEEHKKQDAENVYYNDLVAKIVEDSKISVAPEIVAEEAAAMEERLKQQVEQNGLKWDQYVQITGQKEDELKAKLKEQAEKNIKAMLVLSEIASNEKVTVTDKEVQDEYKRLADLYKMDVKKIEEIISKDMSNFKNQMMSKKLHDLLIDLNK